MSRLLSSNGAPQRGYGSVRERYRQIAGNRLRDEAYPIEDKLGEDIDTTELITAHNRRREQRAKVYERIYRKCCHRIRYANDVQYVRECYFQVPEVQLWGGVPRYQINAVIAYIMIRLKQKGFDVRFHPPDGVMINWSRLVAGDSAALSFAPSENKGERVIRYELDEELSKAKPLDQVATPAERLVHRGCKGDCCTNPDVMKPKRVSRRKQIELERRRQQDEIDRLIAQRDGGSD